MNRVKFWLYMVLLLGAGAANLFFLSGELAIRAIVQADQSLGTASAQLEARTRLLTRTTGAVVGIAARSADLRTASQPKAAAPARAKPGRKPGERPASSRAVDLADMVGACKAALDLAGTETGADLGRALAYLVDREGRAVDCMGPPGLEAQLAEFARQAASGARQDYALIGNGIWYVASYPIDGAVSLVLGLPLDATWGKEAKQASGVDLVLMHDFKELFTTLSPVDAKTISAAIRRASSKPGTPTSAGLLPPVKLPFQALASVPPVSLLWAPAPAYRVQTVTVPSIPNALVVLARPMGHVLQPLANYQLLYLAGLAAALLLGIIFSIFIRSDEGPHIPKELIAAASRIARGDFSARAPDLAGKLAAVSSALNRAAELAETAPPPPEPAGGSDEAPPPPLPIAPSPGAKRLDSTAPDFYGEGEALGGSAIPAEPLPPASSAPTRVEEADPFAFTSKPQSPGRADTSFGGGDFPPRVQDRRPAVSAAPPPLPVPPPPPQAASIGDDEEEHWQGVFEEFMRVRQQCGEPSEGLTFERFRAKLEKNRDQLMQKYACKSVRFQVYVKEGRAALKATPVR